MPERGVYEELLEKLGELNQSDCGVLVAIDGRCGSGKTTLARELALACGGTVIHMDDFYLPVNQRKPDWMEQIGGNMDFERLSRQVLQPLRNGYQTRYQPFLCKTGCYGDDILLEPGRLTILEGTYSHHPSLGAEFDWRIFLTCSAEEQKRRLTEREGERFARFREIWIPLEERYFAAYQIREYADLVLETGLNEKGREE